MRPTCTQFAAEVNAIPPDSPSNTSPALLRPRCPADSVDRYGVPVPLLLAVSDSRVGVCPGPGRSLSHSHGNVPLSVPSSVPPTVRSLSAPGNAVSGWLGPPARTAVPHPTGAGQVSAALSSGDTPIPPGLFPPVSPRSHTPPADVSPAVSRVLSGSVRVLPVLDIYFYKIEDCKIELTLAKEIEKVFCS